jgi:hypothetical protein
MLIERRSQISLTRPAYLIRMVNVSSSLLIGIRSLRMKRTSEADIHSLYTPTPTLPCSEALLRIRG